MDLAYGTGLLAFDEVCKRVEKLALQTEDETRNEYIDTQVVHVFICLVPFADVASWLTLAISTLRRR